MPTTFLFSVVGYANIQEQYTMIEKIAVHSSIIFNVNPLKDNFAPFTITFPNGDKTTPRINTVVSLIKERASIRK